MLEMQKLRVKFLWRSTVALRKPCKIFSCWERLRQAHKRCKTKRKAPVIERELHLRRAEVVKANECQYRGQRSD